MEGKDQARGEPIKLLLVDDEEGFVNVLANRLARRKIDVTKAYSGAEAIQVLRRQDFDVAVLDLKMEDMDGIDVLKEIHQALNANDPNHYAIADDPALIPQEILLFENAGLLSVAKSRIQ